VSFESGLIDDLSLLKKCHSVLKANVCLEKQHWCLRESGRDELGRWVF
jgi:hypothetical protein